MKKLLYTHKIYDYGTQKQAKKDIPKMREKGYHVVNEYQAEKTYVVEYKKDSM